MKNDLTTEKISQLLGVDVDTVENSEEINGNLSKSVINEAAKMFFPLYSFPFFYEKLYLKAIYETNTRTMALILSKIIKKADQDFKVDAQKIFAKVSQIIGFKHISYYREGNDSFMLMKQILGIKGEKI